MASTCWPCTPRALALKAGAEDWNAGSGEIAGVADTAELPDTADANTADLTNGEIVVRFDVAPGEDCGDCRGCVEFDSVGSLAVDVAALGSDAAAEAESAASADGGCSEAVRLLRLTA